jgi:hypothetical protein
LDIQMHTVRLMNNNDLSYINNNKKHSLVHKPFSLARKKYFLDLKSFIFHWTHNKMQSITSSFSQFQYSLSQS